MTSEGYHDDTETSTEADLERAQTVAEPAVALNNGVAGVAAQSLNAPLRSTSQSDDDDENVAVPPADEAKRKRFIKRVFIGVLGGLTLLWVIGLVFYLASSMRNKGAADDGPFDGGRKKTIELDEVLNGTFRAKRVSIDWLDDGIVGHDGLYAEHDESGKLLVGDYSGATISGTKILIDSRTFKYGSVEYHIANAWPGKGLRKALLLTNAKKNWRHSYFGMYWILDVDTKEVTPLIPGDLNANVRIAKWSPTGEHVAYVLENNLYVRNASDPTSKKQVTQDGDKDLFYGIPDWVYEEEVFSGNSALWWADSGKYLAFLRSNDSMVPEYSIPYFEQHPIEDGSYPEMVDIKYPKAGYSNPIVELMLLDLSTYEVFLPEVKDARNLADDDRLITEVLWIGEKVLMRQTNRESDLLKIVIIDPASRTGSVVREEDVSGQDGGWFEVTHDTAYIPANKSQGREQDGYIDTVIVDGYNHLAYFEPVDATLPKTILTRGDWEVVDAPSSVDLSTGTVYFIATKKDPTERHVYSVKLDGTGFASITDQSKDGYYSAFFSTGGGYCLLSYNGPEVPWQKLLSLREGTETILQENPDLKKTLALYDVPETIWEKVTLEEGVTVNTFEIRPADFDPHKVYPVLFHLYQGPGSQTVDKRFSIGFETHVASQRHAIIVSVDGRGTGFMGRKFRAVVRDNLGYWEAHDQILAARIWAKKSYVDSSRIAIWGWSYGGYMTLKTIEQDGGRTFRYGMAVAPVTDWRFYDSIYTERYMHTPQHNFDGYDGAAIKNVTALKGAGRFLVMHGTGDDNVHFQNTLALLDKLDLAQVENYDMYVFPDSDHSINFHNGNKVVYDRLSRWIGLAFVGALGGSGTCQVIRCLHCFINCCFIKCLYQYSIELFICVHV
ncbi:putative dipeptidyl-aminopeptidase B [Myxozyma melibiosi]|uniref:Dipeptidyl-aminopeptidase B n=1 Tax=Myxozyma melibiosi TaxID=54550 RepID=A0ABR1FFA8_9ASCO